MPQLFPDGAPHRVHAIRNYGERIEVAAATVIAGPKVAMAAGLADGAATVEEPGNAVQEALAQRGGQAHIGAAHIAQRSKAAIQTGAHEPRGEMRQIRERRLRHAREVQTGGVDVYVRVDQPGHEDAARAIDDVHLFVRRPVERPRTWGKPADDAAGNEHIETFAQHLGIAVKDARVAEKNRHFGSISHCEDLHLKPLKGAPAL